MSDGGNGSRPQVDFVKALSRITEVTDEASLLRVACEELSGNLGILIERRRADGTPCRELKYTHPQFDEAASENWEEILNPYARNQTEKKAYAQEIKQAIEIGERKFPGFVMGFGKPEDAEFGHRHEMLILRGSGAVAPRETSSEYIAKKYLEQYELFVDLRTACEANRNDYEVADGKRREKEKAYVDLMRSFIHRYEFQRIQELFQEEQWDLIKKELDGAGAEARTQRYAFWVARVVRKRRTTLTRESEEVRRNYEDLKERIITESKRIEKEGQEHGRMIRFLLEHGELDIGPFLRSLRAHVQRVLKADPSSAESQIETELNILVIEHGWQRLLYRCLGWEKHEREKENESENDLKDYLQLLLGLTTELIHGIVVPAYEQSRGAEAAGETTEEPLQELGRGFLRLYFAMELTRMDSKLAKLHFHRGGETVSRESSPQLQRIYLVNLSRFMLVTLAVIRTRLGIPEETPAIVSPTEELDCLLYLVDRFSHVELGVDERLNLREELAKQIGAEVQHHLNVPHYRDHLLHAIDVFLLGYVLLKTHLHWFNDEEHMFADHLAYLTDQNGCRVSRKRLLENWAVASLLHDIGYQLGHGTNISRNPKSWKKYFDLLGRQGKGWLKLEGTGSSRASTEDDFQGMLEFLKNLNEHFVSYASLEGCIPANSLAEIQDHGVVSALRVAQLLIHAGSQDTMPEPSGRIDLLERYGQAIHAIAHHNLFHKGVQFQTHPLACLLRICDELQEWDRRRVNIERIVKRLYLDLHHGHYEVSKTYEIFSSFKANLVLRKSCPEKAEEDPVIRVLTRQGPKFRFFLDYFDPIEGHYDPTMTLLCKAFNLQHVDLTVHVPDGHLMDVSIELRFPVPPEYEQLSEYDIYSLFTQEVKGLPLLRGFSRIDQPVSGLIRLEPTSMKTGTGGGADGRTRRDRSHEDRFAVIVKADSKTRIGWLPLDPDQFFERFIEFKKEVLSRNKNRWNRQQYE